MKKVNRVSKVAIAALCAAFAVLNVGPLVGQAAKADELENTANETFYCADGDDDFIYGGEGETADATYEIEFDYYEKDKFIIKDIERENDAIYHLYRNFFEFRNDKYEY